MIVVYHGRDELLVTTEQDERQLLRDYFSKDSGRDLDDYERLDSTGNSGYEAVRISLLATAEFE